MIKSKLGNNKFLLLAATCFFISAITIHQNNSKPLFDIEMQDRALNVNKDILRIFSIGNKRTISNILWVQTLLESDSTHYNAQDRKNWMYLRFDTIATLDPLFYQNYLWGGMYLSIIKNDMIGASDIFDRGLHYYPDDYELNYRQGFNHYFELGNFEKGLSYLEKIVDHPKTVPSLKFVINKLRFETSNDYDSALSFLATMIDKEKDQVILEKLQRDFYALKAQRDLECLNDGRENCDRRDAAGNFYIKEGNNWRTVIEFKPYRIYLPKR